MKVIVINGHAQSGKSTFVSMCKDYPGVDVYEFSMGDAVKAMAKVIGWDESQKSPRDRKFLSDLKDLIEDYNDGAYEYVKYLIDNFVPDNVAGPQVVFIHARNIEDINRLVKDYNARTLVIRRKFVEGIQLENRADTGWWTPDYDYAVNNNDGLKFLRKTSEDFMEYILSEDWEYEKGEN